MTMLGGIGPPGPGSSGSGPNNHGNNLWRDLRSGTIGAGATYVAKEATKTVGQSASKERGTRSTEKLALEDRVLTRRLKLIQKDYPVSIYARDQALDGVQNQAIMTDITECAKHWKDKGILGEKEEIYLDFKKKYNFTINQDEGEIEFFEKDQGGTESLDNQNSNESTSGGESSFASISSSGHFKRNKRKIEDPKQIKQQNQVSHPDSFNEVADSESYEEVPTYQTTRLIPSNHISVDEYHKRKATANMISFGLEWTGMFVVLFLTLITVNRIFTGLWIARAPKQDSEHIMMRKFRAEYNQTRAAFQNHWEKASSEQEKASQLENYEAYITSLYEFLKDTHLLNDDIANDLINMQEEIRIKYRKDLPED